MFYIGKNKSWNQVQNGFWTQCIFYPKKLHQDEKTTKSCIKTHRDTLQNRLAKSASTHSFTMKWVVIHRNTQKGCNTGLESRSLRFLTNKNPFWQYSERVFLIFQPEKVAPKLHQMCIQRPLWLPWFFLNLVKVQAYQDSPRQRVSIIDDHPLYGLEP